MAKKIIKQRAEAIIADAKRYDANTRESIANVLKSDASDLAECVRRAEAGEEIWDLAGEQAKLEIAAQFVLDLWAVERMPNFILVAVESALNSAAKAEGVQIWDDGLSLPALTSLFATTQSLSVKESQAVTLAEHIAAILAHPETPVALYNDIAERITDMSSSINYQSPEMIEHSLAAYALRESRRKGGK